MKILLLILMLVSCGVHKDLSARYHGRLEEMETPDQLIACGDGGLAEGTFIIYKIPTMTGTHYNYRAKYTICNWAERDDLFFSFNEDDPVIEGIMDDGQFNLSSGLIYDNKISFFVRGEGLKHLKLILTRDW